MSKEKKPIIQYVASGTHITIGGKTHVITEDNQVKWGNMIWKVPPKE